MEKCEWKNGTLIGCDLMKDSIKDQTVYANDNNAFYMCGPHNDVPITFCPHCGVSLTRNPVGLFGTFWDETDSHGEKFYGVVTSFDPESDADVYELQDGYWYQNFTPGTLLSDFNEDGTPKLRDTRV